LSIVQMARAGVFRKGPGTFWTSRWTNAVGEEVASIGYLLTSTPEGSLALRLTYTITNLDTGEKTPLNYTIEITSTGCHFGGQRHWLRCPLIQRGIPCGRRVGKLYLPPGGRYFGCRQCHNLTYRSAKEHDKRVDALTRLPPEVLRRVLEWGYHHQFSGSARTDQKWGEWRASRDSMRRGL
jgi:hypothetical protein